MHHVYFSGEPSIHMALGAFFSAAEVIPLTFLTLEAWSFLQLGAQQGSNPRTPFPHFWAVMFLASVGFWNFLGAGIFGFLINLPIVSYYEIGTALTANHGHAAMMGVYGMLAVGTSSFLLAIHGPGKSLERPSGQDQFLVPEHRACLDGICYAISFGRPAALSLSQRRIFRRAIAEVPLESYAMLCWSGCGFPGTHCLFSEGLCPSSIFPGSVCVT